MTLVEHITVTDKEELIQALKDKAEIINVNGDFSKEILHYKKEQLSDTERLGFELGSGGLGNILELVLDRTFDYFDKTTSKSDKALKNKIIAKYYINKIDSEHVSLRLKQLDY